ncbi:16S rRNA (cytosine(967)-C(5))-methyltransferase [Oculatella sp. LEGE 06141]|nr:16S rRNA (cytosine(967)-C(5))-methyltransferase [Oculatella sp. LEGE 06141]MBE9182864.1 16S rRNA (cytosine(967)-C(5))-methyltransferase [Oculatella sp. LEGE 06141]
MGDRQLQTDSNPRQLAFTALRSVQRGAFADVAIDRLLQDTSLNELDRRLTTELVYGCVRRQRTLDALIDQLATRKAHQQPPDLRAVLQVGLYQVRYLSQIPVSAAVNTTVDLAKRNGLSGLSGFVNGLMRQYVRLSEAQPEPLQLPDNPVERLGLLHSFPDWIVQVWLDQFGWEATEALCQWMNRSPHIDLRINPIAASMEQVEAAMQSAGIAVSRIPPLPYALRLPPSAGAIQKLPGFDQGWWTVQDCSAQLVSHLVNPQPGEIVIDACAAPGGKTTHLAELMQDRGTVWGCDRSSSRLKKLQQNANRLQLQSIKSCAEDSLSITRFTEVADRVLLDAPCSGLGTLHRHADARWRQTPDSVKELAQLQHALLNQTATWVKPGGTLVYATCTLHPAENESVIKAFLAEQPHWSLYPPSSDSVVATFFTPDGWGKVLPHQQNMDGFFMVRLQRSL